MRLDMGTVAPDEPPGCSLAFQALGGVGLCLFDSKGFGCLVCRSALRPTILSPTPDGVWPGVVYQWPIAGAGFLGFVSFRALGLTANLAPRDP